MGSWKNIATLLRAKTKEGGLSVKSAEGLPFLLEEGMEVVFVPPILKFPRCAKVQRVEHPAPGKHTIYFDKVTDRSDAEQLEGHCCLARVEDLPEGFDQSDSLEVIGYRVSDAVFGDLGVVISIEENPAHPLLVVENDNTNDTVLIPFVDDFIAEIDEAAQRIYVCVPDGLLDL